MAENGFQEAVFAAMGQSFFTLSVGIGALAIFGSDIGKERRLTGEAISITVLETVVALVAGLIIFPSCFAFDEMWIRDRLETVGFVDLGVKARPNLVVLKRTRMPAVLVEAGFINSDTDNELFDSNFQDIAQACLLYTSRCV